MTEFDIQGLEPDYSVVAWDADFRYDGRRWTYNNFVGNKWNNVGSEERKNAYRVLLYVSFNKNGAILCLFYQ